MRISSAFPSKYLRAADLEGKQITVEIANVELEEVGTGEEPKPVLYFQGKSKGVVMNKTNANAIASAYGDDTDDWTGQQIILFSAFVDFQGRSVEAIRVRVPPRKPAPRAVENTAPSAPRETGSGQRPMAPIDDDIPF
jgi:hypothetical protein